MIARIGTHDTTRKFRQVAIAKAKAVASMATMHIVAHHTSHCDAQTRAREAR
jgi:hypothetical protein